MHSIPIREFVTQIHDLWLNQWFLLTSGNLENQSYNSMTVAWGFCGIMWNRPVAVAAVRPTRYTYGFINRYDTFSLCAFPETYRDDLLLLGRKSGRDGDKIAKTRLNVMAAERIAAPVFKEAELILECRKIYWDDFKPDHFLDPKIEQNYSQNDYHRFYFGEILHISGIDRYHARD